jgi:hypothetical protein
MRYADSRGLHIPKIELVKLKGEFCHKDNTNPQNNEFSSIRMRQSYDNCTGLYVTQFKWIHQIQFVLVNFLRTIRA